MISRILKIGAILLPIVFIILLVSFTENAQKKQRQQQPGEYIKIYAANQTITAKLADNAQERSQGLMNVAYLAENEGMFFIFNESGYHTFWMKNTLIPLDMLWLDENLMIVDIKINVPPCEETECPKYIPENPAWYALEVNGGWTVKNNLKIGDQIEILSPVNDAQQ